MDFVLFISWLVTWYFQNHFLTLYCYYNLFWNHRIISELCISFRRAHSKDFKNIYFIEIKRSYRKWSYFSVFVVKMTNFDPGYQIWSCDTSNWSQWAWNHYKNSSGRKFLSWEQIHRKIQILKIFTDDVIVYLSDQKWPGSSYSVIRGPNKSVSCNFIMGIRSLRISSTIFCRWKKSHKIVDEKK